MTSKIFLYRFLTFLFILALATPGVQAAAVPAPSVATAPFARILQQPAGPDSGHQPGIEVLCPRIEACRRARQQHGRWDGERQRPDDGHDFADGRHLRRREHRCRVRFSL